MDLRFDKVFQGIYGIFLLNIWGIILKTVDTGLVHRTGYTGAVTEGDKVACILRAS